MKRTKKFLLRASLLAFVALCFGAGTVAAQDLAAVVPDDVKVLVDNDKVRILEVVHKPGAKEPMHSHPYYVSVFLGSTRVRVTTPDGKVVEKDRKAGETAFNNPVTHALENIGTGDQHVIVVELK